MRTCPVTSEWAPILPVLPIPSWAGTWVPAAGAVGAEAEEAEAEEAGAVGVFEWIEGFQENLSFHRRDGVFRDGRQGVKIRTSS